MTYDEKHWTQKIAEMTGDRLLGIAQALAPAESTVTIKGRKAEVEMPDGLKFYINPIPIALKPQKEWKRYVLTAQIKAECVRDFHAEKELASLNT